MNDGITQQDNTPEPSIRVYTLGPFIIKRLFSEQGLTSSGRFVAITQDGTVWDECPGPALSVLKALICSQNRHASKSMLAGMLWPDSEESKARHSLVQAARALRSGLGTSQNKSLLTETPGGEGFQLAEQAVLWTDIDAFEQAVKQATRAERQQRWQEARSWWEQAYEVGKQGVFLPDDVYRDWTNARRLSHEVLFQRCVHQLAERYLAEGKPSETEDVLHSFWTTHLTDEDILCLLMEALHAQGFGREALQRYQQSVRALDEELGTQPLPATVALADRIQECLQASSRTIQLNQTHRELTEIGAVSGDDRTDRAFNNVLPEIVSEQSQTQMSSVSLSQKAVDEQAIDDMQYLTLNDQSNEQEKQQDDSERKPSPSRREIVTMLTHTAAAVIGLPNAMLLTVLHPEEVVSLCAVYVPLCWRQYFEGGLTDVAQVLPVYLSALTQVLQEPSRHYKRGAYLAAQASILAGCLEMHHYHLNEALHHVDQALSYGQHAGDLNVQIAALIQRANIYSSFSQPAQKLWAYEQELQAYQEALRYYPVRQPSSTDLSLLLLGRVYIGLAKAYAQLKHTQEALRYLVYAYEVYPEHPEDDIAYTYTYHTRFTLTNHTGSTYLYLGEPEYVKKAWTIFQQIDTVVPKEVVPRRVELSLRQATALFSLQEKDACCTYLEYVITSAKMLGSRLRYNEASGLYTSLQDMWGNEMPVKLIGAHFQ